MRWIGLVGMAVILGIALALSNNRRAIRWRTVGWAFALQLAFAFLVLYWETGKNAIQAFSDKVSNAIGYADRGSAFLFSWLAGPMNDLGSKTGLPIGGFIFAFKVLPIIIFICSFFSLLYYFGIIQIFVKGMAWVMQKTMKVSGAEALCVAANVFIGQTEAPVLIAPYIPAMTQSELLTEIYLQRRYELFGSGLRWEDVRRRKFDGFIVTGTPGGVGAKRTPPLWMRQGDTVEVEISDIGVLSNSVMAEAA